jgi:hypothetical protein
MESRVGALSLFLSSTKTSSVGSEEQISVGAEGGENERKGRKRLTRKSDNNFPVSTETELVGDDVLREATEGVVGRVALLDVTEVPSDCGVRKSEPRVAKVQ